MMTVEEMRNARREKSPVFTHYTLLTGKYPTHLFCFFEGNDNDYYVQRIRTFTDDFKPLRCGNRNAVLDVHRLIAGHKEHEKYKKAFFIDRDFNPPLAATNPPIYETPCYSIENLYVSPEVFERILINKFHLSPGKEEEIKIIAVCMETYKARQNEFHAAVCLFNAWYACLMDIKNATGQEAGASLDEKLPKGFVEVSLQGVTSDYDLEKIKTTFPKATEVETEVLNRKVAEFSTCEQSKVFRGKYEISFLIGFIHLLLKDYEKGKHVVQKKLKFAFGDASSLNIQQAIDIFSDCAETPKCLRDYLALVTQ
jgi:hypothetical protein